MLTNSFKTFVVFIPLLLFLSSCSSQETKESKEMKREYEEVLKTIEIERKNFNEGYLKADSNQKDSILQKANQYLIHMLTDTIFEYWYGTKWDFNGTTQIPRQGRIACGYFVTTTLQDISFDIPRVKWAQLASETFILKISKNVKRFSNKPVKDIEPHLKKSGDGVYIVGLDSHVGYIVVKGSKISFVHSSYYQPEIGVMSEEIDSDNPLNDSKYRVIGKIFSKEMVRNWILGKKY